MLPVLDIYTPYGIIMEYPVVHFSGHFRVKLRTNVRSYDRSMQSVQSSWTEIKKLFFFLHKRCLKDVRSRNEYPNVESSDQIDTNVCMSLAIRLRP